MSTNLREGSRQLHPDYLALIKRFLLRPIRSEKQHGAAIKMAAALAVHDEGSLTKGERDYLDALVVLLEEYDRRHSTPPAMLDGLELLRHLMATNGLNVSDVGRIIGNQSTASLILAGRRAMSKSVIEKLAQHFSVNPGLFLRRKVEAV